MDDTALRKRRVAAVLLLAAAGAGGLAFWRLGGREQHRNQPAAARDSSNVGDRQDQIAFLSREPAPRAADDDYVGSAACAACHEDIARSFAEHPMARSMALIATAAPLGDYTDETTFAPPGPRRYRIERQGDRVWHHEIMLARGGTAAAGLDNGVLYDQAVEIRYALGSGTRGRSYLIDRDGQLFASSINWYSTAHRWDLAPGYPPENHLRFERLVREECLFCHAGRTAPSQPPAERYAEPPFRETAIGCERCHGPGRRHIEDERSPAGHGGSGSSIVNPSRLVNASRDSVCNQCHLHGEIRIPRANRELDDYRPGDQLEDVLAVFVQPTPPREAGALRAVSQVEQMASSTCYRESGGALGCISCHDPHRATPHDERDTFFRQRCLKCHGAGDCTLPEDERRASSASDSCVHCHMPGTSAGGIPHTAQTDHRILQRSASRTVDTARDLEKLRFFSEGGARFPDWEQSRVRGIMLLELGARRPDRAALAAQAESLLRIVLREAPRDVPLLHFLGTACVRQGRPGEARDFWEQALGIEPERIDTLLAHAVVCEALGEWDKSARSFERLVHLSPWQADPFVRYAGLLLRMNHWEKAIQMAERALEIDPMQLEARRILAEASASAGRSSESRRQIEILRQMLQATSN